MKKTVVLMLVLVASVALVGFMVPSVRADTTIYVRPDGSIVGTDLISRNGNTYTFTANITSPIRLEKSSITLDGAGYTLEGHRVGDAINLTCTNTTIKNLRITDWSTGILGSYNNNTITDNFISGCDSGIKIYADNFRITGNTITHNEEGIRLHGGNNIISNNTISGSKYGIYLQGYASNQGNTMRRNTIANNEVGMYIFVNTWGAQQEVNYNNFVQNKRQVTNTGANLKEWIPMKTSNWSHDSVGNYWSNYNGTDTDGDNIGDTPHVIDAANSDNYPLIQPATVLEPFSVLSPTPSLTSKPTPSQTPTPIETQTPPPSSSPQPTQSPQMQTSSALPIGILALGASVLINIILAIALAYKRKQTK